jgi:glycerol kinase
MMPRRSGSSTLTTCRLALDKARLTRADIAAIGITNQRETTILWDRETGKPIHKAIVWQDRRTSDYCCQAELRAAGHDPQITARTGLLLDAYFSGTKIHWLLDHVPGAMARSGQGRPALFRHGGHLPSLAADRRPDPRHRRHQRLPHDALQYPPELLGRGIAPPVRHPCVDNARGDATPPPISAAPTRPFSARSPSAAFAGDQQAALVGQACFSRGMIKSTYGTGCSSCSIPATRPIRSKNRLLTTIGYRLNGKTTYALEGRSLSPAPPSSGCATPWA